jgi:hypothetical protein
MKPALLLYLVDRQPHGWSRVGAADMAAMGLGAPAAGLVFPPHLARDDYIHDYTTASGTATTTASRTIQGRETISQPRSKNRI